MRIKRESVGVEGRLSCFATFAASFRDLLGTVPEREQSGGLQVRFGRYRDY